MIDKLSASGMRALPTQSSAPRSGQPATESAAGGDRLVISDQARELALAQAAVRNSPDVRAARVAELRQRVATGDYHVPVAALARKLLEFKG
jgi:negative regulator of flagellin synthesis FlgM